MDSSAREYDHPRAVTCSAAREYDHHRAATCSAISEYDHHRAPLFLVRERFGEEPPDSANEDDALEELADEITTLAAHIHAATHRLLELIAEFDRRGGWKAGGHRSCAHWLAFRTGIDLGAAREKVRTARVLVGLPETSASMARGELSFSAVRALTRVATPETEADLLELARGCTTAQLERVVRSWRKNTRATEAELEQERHGRRCVSVFPDDDGMYVLRGRVPAEVGALLMRAIEAASDALYQEERVGGGSSAPTSGPPSSSSVASPPPLIDDDTSAAAARRRADALALVAERALNAGFGAGGAPSAEEAGGGEGVDSAPPPTPISGTRAERYQVMIHVSAETLSADQEPGRSHLDDGTRVSAETSRRLACDAARVRVIRGEDGSVLDVGRRTRTVSPALRRALEVRDRGCRFPGCGLRFTDAHHVTHWADGGETSLGNCLLLCRYHHRLMHEGGWTIEWWGEGRPAFLDPRGHVHFEGRWSPPKLGENPVVALMRANRARGADPDWRTAGARWKREADIPEGVYFRALEATG